MKEETKATLKRALVDERTRNALLMKGVGAVSAYMVDDRVKAAVINKTVMKGVGKVGEFAAKASSPQGQAAFKAALDKNKQANLHDQWIDFKYWLKMWAASMSLTKVESGKTTDAMFRYPWILDELKTTHLAKTLARGRTGASKEALYRELVLTTKAAVEGLQNIITDPEHTVMTHDMIPSEITQAMGIKVFLVEAAANVIGLDDQHAPEKYLDAMYAQGLPDNTCTYSTQTPGMFAVDEYFKKASCLIATNMPCEAHFEGYSMMIKEMGIPTYWLDVPYNFHPGDPGAKTFVEDIKGMVAFLEEHTGKKMNWVRLKEVCERKNELTKMRTQLWDLNRALNPPLTGDALYYAYMPAFHLAASTQEDVDLYKRITALALRNYASQTPCFENIRYRTVMWSTPPFDYAGIYGWVERCWGIEIVNDMEEFGTAYTIDTSTPDTMLEGLANCWCDAAMARHMRGPAENWIDGLNTLNDMYQPDFILDMNHLNCRGYTSLTGFLNEWGKDHVPVCVCDYNFFDTRVVSRQGMRTQINNFMFNVMHADPLDPSLLEFDDSQAW